jgi:hypothetical protein
MSPVVCVPLMALGVGQPTLKAVLRWLPIGDEVGTSVLALNGLKLGSLKEAWPTNAGGRAAWLGVLAEYRTAVFASGWYSAPAESTPAELRGDCRLSSEM